MKNYSVFQRKGYLKKLIPLLFLCSLLQGNTYNYPDITTETAESAAIIVNESLKGIIINQIQKKSQQDVIQEPKGSAPPHISEEVNTSYIIVTTNEIESNSLELQEFKKYKQYLGFNVEIVTEDDYGFVFGQDRAHAIRTWLQNQQAPKNIEYVLLIGDPDDQGDVPMLKVWPRSGVGSYEYTFTDYYYADLTGNWDTDSDGLYGEYDQDTDVDFQAEVFVGRIPVYGTDYSTLDEILFRIRTHHNQTYAGKNNILLPMAISNYANEDGDGDLSRTDGLNLPEELYTNVLAGLGMNDTVLYEGAGIDPVLPSAFHYTNNLTASNFETYFNYDQGAVLWWGHGNDDGAYRKYWGEDDNIDGLPDALEMETPAFVSSSSVGNLETDVPAFIYQSSCNNGDPENSNNLGYALLKRGAAISTVAATQVSWYGVGEWETILWEDYSDNTGLGYKYMDNLLRLNLPAGNALFESKYYGGEGFGAESWMNKMDFNLYGDPQLDYWGSLKATATNPSPAANSSEIPSSVELEVFVEDPDSNSLTVSFYNADDDSLIGTQFDVTSGNVASVSWDGLFNDTSYEWYTVVSDGQSYNISQTWNFTTFQEPAPPTWDPTPVNQLIEFGEDWYYDLNATDPAGIDSYNINDTTYFNLDSETGNLTTVGFLPFGIYSVEIMVNDTLGNENNITLVFHVQDTKSPNTANWEPELFVELGDPFIMQYYFTDVSGVDTILLNNTINFSLSQTGLLENRTSLPVDHYALQIQVNDTIGNCIKYNLSLFVQDTTSPTWEAPPPNQTLVEGGAVFIQFIATDLSDVTYSINSTEYFMINEMGVIQNNTFLTNGTYWIEISVFDQYGNELSTVLEIIVELNNAGNTQDTPLQPLDTNTQLGIIGGMGGVIVIILIIAKKKS